MDIASITFNYDVQKNVIGYIVYVDGKVGDVKSFNGQVNLSKEDINLDFVLDAVKAKITESFTKEE